MKKSKDISKALTLIGFLVIVTSCNNDKNPELPELGTEIITAITQTTAKSGGIIKSNGGSEIISKGVCWSKGSQPTVLDSHTSDGTGSASFTSIITDLTPGDDYCVRAYATNTTGTAYGDEKTFKTVPSASTGQIIADHTIVDRFDDIPQAYLEKVKEMWVVIAGESHSAAYRTGLTRLESTYPAYAVSVIEYGTPEANNSSNLRASRATWGDYSKSTGWVYTYGEEDWFTNPLAIERTKAGITYCNTHSLNISAIGFGWCWDMVYGDASTTADPAYGCRWYGESINGPEGDRYWGLNSEDYSITGNSVSMDTYLNATQAYIDYCAANGYSTKVFFTTGPVDTYYSTGEAGYQGSIKHQYIRDYVRRDPTRILFDYADILCYDDNGVQTTATWNGHTFPRITPANGSPEQTGHISNIGSVRLAKAMWWMLARIAGWDGN